MGKVLIFVAKNLAQEIGAEGVRLNSGSERTKADKFYEKIGYDKAKTQAKFQKIF